MIIAHVILKNDRWAITVLFEPVLAEMGEEDVSALEFPVLLQNCTSMLLCAKPAAGCFTNELRSKEYGGMVENQLQQRKPAHISGA